MRDIAPFEIRLSRMPLAALCAAGLFFFFMGLDIGFFHKLIPAFTITPDKKIIFFAFLVFFIGFGGVIAVQMIVYLMAPPVMLRADAVGIGFGTGFRYKLYTVPWCHVTGIGTGAGATVTNVTAGLQVSFAENDEVPSALPTSLGVSFFMNTLTLSLTYMDCSLAHAEKVLKQLQKQQ
jgi:hypothetical protein